MISWGDRGAKNAADTLPNKLAIMRWYSGLGVTFPVSQRFHWSSIVESSGSSRVLSYWRRCTHSFWVHPRRRRSFRIRRAQGCSFMSFTFLTRVRDVLVALGGHESAT